MKILCVHEREMHGSIEQVGEIVKTHGSSIDRMYPHELWPKTQMEGSDGPPEVGRIANRGALRFIMTSFEIGIKVHYSWKFIEPAGFDGYHQTDVEDRGNGKLLFKTFVEMETRGLKATLLWLFVMRPLHNAIVEDCFDKIERQLGLSPKGHKWSLWVKTLRRVRRAKFAEYQRLHQEELSRRAVADESR